MAAPRAGYEPAKKCRGAQGSTQRHPPGRQSSLDRRQSPVPQRGDRHEPGQPQPGQPAGPGGQLPVLRTAALRANADGNRRLWISHDRVPARRPSILTRRSGAASSAGGTAGTAAATTPDQDARRRSPGERSLHEPRGIGGRAEPRRAKPGRSDSNWMRPGPCRPRLVKAHSGTPQPCPCRCSNSPPPAAAQRCARYSRH